MMKLVRYYIFIGINIVLAFSVKGQSLLNSSNGMAPKHIAGIKAVSLSYNMSKHGIGGTMDITRYFNKKISMSIGGTYNTGKVGYTNFDRYLAQMDVSKTIFDINEVLFLNISVTTGLGIENVTLETLEKEETAFTNELGVAAGLEIYILPMLSASIGIRQIIISNSKMGKGYYYIPISLCYYY